MILETIIFGILAILCVGSALWMIATKNPVRSALALVVAFLSVAGLYIMLSAQFIAAVQVIVYAGAIMVLFLFVIMLLNLGAPSALKDTGGMSRWVAVGLGVGLLVVLFGTQSINLLPDDSKVTIFNNSKNVTDAGSANIPARYSLADIGTVETIGKVLYDPRLPWLFPFEAVSILLLISVVGAIIMAKRHVS